MSSLYPNIATYEAQLRKLEDYTGEKPNAPDGYFLLAYHYLTMGHTKNAAGQLRKELKLAPKDTVSAQLLELIESKDNVPTEQPKTAASTAKIDMSQLIGTWSATRGKASFVMTLDKDKGFTWSYTEGKTKQEAKGAFTVDGNTLAMEPDAGGVMLAEITAPQGGAFSFKVVGAPKSDTGLTFQKK
jgi:hypothetical protein